MIIINQLEKKDLQEMAKLTHYQMTKLARGENVTTDIVGKICAALNVKADDIMDFIPDKE